MTHDKLQQVHEFLLSPQRAAWLKLAHHTSSPATIGCLSLSLSLLVFPRDGFVVHF